MTTYNESDDAFGAQMWKARCDLRYRASVSALYHRKREWFFGMCDMCGKAAVWIAASLTIAPFVTGTFLTVLQLSVVVTAPFALFWSSRARRHCDFAVRYAKVECAIVVVGEVDFSTDDLKRRAAELYEIQSGEPAALHGLVQVCQDELDMAAGAVVEPARLALMRKFLAHLGFGSMALPTTTATS